MHEFSIVEELLRTLEEIIAREGLCSVERVRVRVGERRQIVPELMRFAFDTAKDGTAAAEAALELEEVETRLRCRHCGAEFGEPELCEACPRCGSPELTLMAGKEIEIVSIEGEQE